MVKKIEEANYQGNRFNTLLRFGLSSGGTGDLAVTKRAFSEFEKSQSNPVLRTKIFSATDKAFDYVLKDDLLYNRFLLLLQRDSMFKEEKLNLEFEKFLLENVYGNYVCEFATQDDFHSFIVDTEDKIEVDWISEDTLHLQFKADDIDKIVSIIEKTNAKVQVFEGDIRG